MQRNPPVIRNAFLGNTGNYSFGAAATAAAASAAITTSNLPPLPHSVVSLYLEDDRTNRTSSHFAPHLDAGRVSIRLAVVNIRIEYRCRCTPTMMKQLIKYRNCLSPYS